MLQSLIDWLLSSSAQQPVTSRTNLTKREVLAITAMVAIIFIFCPAELRFLRNIGVVGFLVWLAASLFDLYMAVPPLVLKFLDRAFTSNEPSSPPRERSLGYTLNDIAEILAEINLKLKVILLYLFTKIRVISANVLRHTLRFVDPRYPKGVP